MRILSTLLLFISTAFAIHHLIDQSPTTATCQDKHHHSSFCKVAPSPSPTILKQIDGQDLNVKIKGSAAVHYLETLDGFTLLKDTDGAYKYAHVGDKGKLVCSDILARNTNQRSNTEQQFLQGLDKHLKYNTAQLQIKKAAANALKSIPTIPNGNNTSGIFPSTGTRKALLLLVDYPDQTSTFNNSNFDDLTNQVGYNVNGQNGSFRDYYKDISYDALVINTDVEGWYMANNNRSTYGDDNNDYGGVDVVREAVDAAEAAGVDFSQYDGDGDGAVDVVMVIHSGRGAEESGNGDDIWSHRWVLAANNKQVNYDGVLINDYIIQAETYGSSNAITNIGVLCHEFGHALGLPDLYDTDGSSEGIGRWCLMAGGTWNNAGKTPAQMSAWCKKELGWTPPTLLTGSGSITDMDHNDNNAIMYRMNTPNPQEYFLIENRQQVGWDAYLPGEGLAIWHIDENITNGGGNGINTDDTHYGVHLEQADAMLNLNNGDNRGDQGDLFPGSSGQTVFNNDSSPNAKNYNGDDSGVNISSVVETGTTVSFDYGATGTISYCGASGSDASYEWIDSVVVGGITNASGSNGGYVHFTDLPISLTQNDTETIRLVPGFATTSYTEYFKVWIDYDQNGNFDAGNELVFESTAAATDPVSGSFTIPASSTLGETRMRVMMKWIDATDLEVPTSCLQFSYGEVEDYNITIIAGATVIAPIANFAVNTTSGVAPLTVNFSDVSTNSPTNWQWIFPGGTPSSSTQQNPTVVYNTPGNHNVTLLATNSAGNDTKTVSNYITVNQTVIAPVTNFSANTTSGDAPLTVSFSDISTNSPTSWEWTFPGGTPSSSTQQNPTVVYNTPGNYSVTLVTSNSAGNDSKVLNNYITATQAVIVPVASFSANTTVGEAPLSVAFSDLSTEEPTSWQWSFPGGTPSSSTQQNPTVVYNTPGNYNVTLVATNAAGSNTKTLINYITTMPAVIVPVANFSANITSGGTPLTVNFSDISMNEPTSWEWSFPGGTPSSSTQQNPTVVYDTPGNYNVTLVAINSAGNHTKNLVNYITATQPVVAPLADFAANVTSGEPPLSVSFNDLSSNEPTAWEWIFEGGMPNSSTEQNPVVIYEDQGVFGVNLTATNTAGNSSITKQGFISVILTALDEHEIIDYLLVAPNPSRDLFRIKMELKSTEAVSFRIYDLMGKTIYTNTLRQAQKIDFPIDLQDQATGMYLMDIQIGATRLTEKLLLLK
ncbi:MAG: M6 family metalloprotease domain-containing protein [Saprospiraceae bacterium]